MAKKKYGKIINIASTQGLLGIPLTSPYAAAKGGVLALTREMATELSPIGINVNCIAPGLTMTAHAMSAMPPEMAGYLGSVSPIRRLGKQDDYVGIVVYLSSDESSYATGATFCIDGGLGSSMLVPAG
jgi:NAD(P)-dependent dehydrogenase (short-subunit alcohol dehydrogenase family)